jgi:hypothetical protein
MAISNVILGKDLNLGAFAFLKIVFAFFFSMDIMKCHFSSHASCEFF